MDNRLFGVPFIYRTSARRLWRMRPIITPPLWDRLRWLPENVEIASFTPLPSLTTWFHSSLISFFSDTAKILIAHLSLCSLIPAQNLLVCGVSNGNTRHNHQPCQFELSFHHSYVFRVAKTPPSVASQFKIHLWQSRQLPASSTCNEISHSLVPSLTKPFKQQPLLHAIVFLLEIMFISILTRRYNSYYAARPGTSIESLVAKINADTNLQSLPPWLRTPYVSTPTQSHFRYCAYD